MSLLSHQSAVNPERNFWLKNEGATSSINQFVKTAGGSVMEYDGDIRFQVDAAGALSTARMLGVANTLFIQSPTGTAFTLPQDGAPKVAINQNGTGTNNIPALYVSSITQLDSKLILANFDPNEATCMLIGTTNPAGQQQAYYQLYNGNASGGGLQPSTLQLFSYAGGNIAQNIQFYPDGVTYIPTAQATNLQATQITGVSTINGAPVNPSEASTQFSTIVITPTTTGNNLAATFPNVPSNAICEGFASGIITWTATPTATDYVVASFGGGSAQLVDNLALNIVPAAYDGAQQQAYFNLAGYFQTSATATDATLNIQFFVNTPTDYGATFINGNFRVIGLQ